MPPRPGQIGILAGGGSLPREIAEAAARRGLGVHIVAIDSEAGSDFGSFPVSRVGFGEVGAMVRALKAAGAERLVIVGRARRPDLSRLKTDLGFWLALPRILGLMAAGGDDSVLRGVVAFFESRGLAVVGPAEVAPELVVGEGPLGALGPSAADAEDIALGFAVVGALGSFDIGQGAVVANGEVEAIEGAEGTDPMLARVAERRRGSGAPPRGVLVKRSKPGQELRVDMPAIGPDTIAAAAAAGLKGVAVEAGRVLVADRDALVARAAEAGLFVVGMSGRAAPGSRAAPGARGGVRKYRALTRRGPGRSVVRDIEIGAALLEALAPLARARAAAVARRHVLAIETGEGVAAAIGRAARLRQWGRRGSGRSGAIVLADAAGLTEAALEAAGKSRLGGLAVLAPVPPGPSLDGLVARAEALGLFVAAVESAGGGP